MVDITGLGASASYSKYHELILMPPDLEEQSQEDLPEYLSNLGHDQESEVISNPFSSPPLSRAGSTSLSDNNCIICYRPKPLKDVATCGDQTCDQEFDSWQGSSHTSAGSPSINRCPVCNDFKLSDDTICGKEFCMGRLRFWEGLPIERRSSNHLPGSSSYFPAIQSSSGASPLSDDNCIICHRPKPLKDVATCGDQTCDQELMTCQGYGSSLSNSGPSSSNRCPVCNDFKLVDITCGKETCLERLRFSEGISSNDRSLPNSIDPRSSFTSNGRPGSSFNSAATRTRSQTHTGGHMCSVCHQRPRYSRNGKSYPVCGLTCAAKLNPSGRVEMCDLCHKQPKVVLNGRTYPHCGRTCRDKARGAKANNGFSRRSCATCLNCWKAPANLRKDEFCSESCRNAIEYRAPLLLEVPRGHASFTVVEKEFKCAWTQRGAPCPSVKKIYMVCIPAKQEANFEDYGKKVSSTGRRKEEFRWISGQRDCPLGQPGMMTPCRLPQCQLCTVLRGTYVPEIFDKGILTTSLPRAMINYDRWAGNNPKFKFSKLVLLSKIYPGKVVELDSLQARSGPPKGANSVRVKLGDYVHNSRGDMDEIFVYRCEALRPVYLISYE